MTTSPPSILLLASLGQTFTWIDWFVVVGYLGLTTIIGGVFAGRQATIRDFFLGGRKLPWYAVCGSIIATEISAVTFVGLPYVVFMPGGNFTYLQLGVFGALFARLIVGYVLVPAYYQREIYSPYDYVGHQLGEGARKTTTILFTLGGVLAQSARVYLTAIVLELLLGDSIFGDLQQATGISTMTWSVLAIGFVAIGWTLMGGIATVIWTDVMLFLVFLGGAAAALYYVVASLDGGLAEMTAVGREAGKFRFLDASLDPTRAYTIWAAVIASTLHNVGAYGTDQMMAQRMFCCRGAKEARRAIIVSYAGLIVTVLVMFVGAGLYAYYRAHPLSGDALTAYEADPNRIFPIFILQVIPTGLKGLLIAGVFAAAISSLDSILVALSQTTVGLLKPGKEPRAAGVSPREPALSETAESNNDNHSDVRLSRVFVVLWGIALCGLAMLAGRAVAYYPSLLDLALAMAGYTFGALTAAVVLALLRVPGAGRGLCWSGPISVLAVFALVWHQVWAQWTCVAAATAIVLLWFAVERRGRRSSARAVFVKRTMALLAALALVVVLSQWAYGVQDDTYVVIAWPWYAPVGCTFALVFGLLLREESKEQ